MQISTAGATIGQLEENTISIPSDCMLAPLNHAIVKYEQPQSSQVPITAMAESSPEDLLSSEGESLASGPSIMDVFAVKCRDRVGGEEEGDGDEEKGLDQSESGAGGGFFLSDGGQETDFAAALRIRVGEGNTDWPLKQVREPGRLTGWLVFRLVGWLVGRCSGGGRGAAAC